MRRFIYALVVWVVVSVALWILARLLNAIGVGVTGSIADFLDKTNVIIGFLAALWYYFFGYPDAPGRFI